MVKIKENIPTLEIGQTVRKGISIKMIDDQAVNDETVYQTHRDNHYMLIMAFEGRYQIMVDFEQITSVHASLLFIHPGQVHQLVNIESPVGIIMDIDAMYIPEELYEALQHPSGSNGLISLKPPYSENLKTLGGLLNESIPDRFHFSQDFIASCVSSLLMLVTDLIRSEDAEHTAPNKGRSITVEFMRMLKEHFRQWKRPSEYADSLCISTGYLNETVRNHTGKSVSIHIQETSILEARRLLFFTEHDVKSISYEVGYEDPAYFSRLFKKICGMTPLDFRAKIRDSSYRYTEQTYPRGML